MLDTAIIPTQRFVAIKEDLDGLVFHRCPPSNFTHTEIKFIPSHYKYISKNIIDLVIKNKTN